MHPDLLVDNDKSYEDIYEWINQMQKVRDNIAMDWIIEDIFCRVAKMGTFTRSVQVIFLAFQILLIGNQVNLY